MKSSLLLLLSGLTTAACSSSSASNQSTFSLTVSAPVSSAYVCDSTSTNQTLLPLGVPCAGTLRFAGVVFKAYEGRSNIAVNVNGEQVFSRTTSTASEGPPLLRIMPVEPPFTAGDVRVHGGDVVDGSINFACVNTTGSQANKYRAWQITVECDAFE